MIFRHSSPTSTRDRRDTFSGLRQRVAIMWSLQRGSAQISDEWVGARVALRFRAYFLYHTFAIFFGEGSGFVQNILGGGQGLLKSMKMRVGATRIPSILSQYIPNIQISTVYHTFATKNACPPLRHPACAFRKAPGST